MVGVVGEGGGGVDLADFWGVGTAGQSFGLFRGEGRGGRKVSWLGIFVVRGGGRKGRKRIHTQNDHILRLSQVSNMSTPPSER